MTAMPSVPAALRKLFEEDTNFGAHIRLYNNKCAAGVLRRRVCRPPKRLSVRRLAFASCSMTNETLKGGVSALRISGKMHHRIGSLAPAEGQDATWGQVYFLDQADQLQSTWRRGGPINDDTMGALTELIVDGNLWSGTYRTAAEQIREMKEKKISVDNYKIVIHADQIIADSHARQANAPTGQGVGEMAIVMTGEAPRVNRDVARGL